MSNEIINTEETALATPTNIEIDIPEGFICTVDITTDEGAIKAANAMGAAASLNKADVDELTIVDIITKPGVRYRTGEPCTDVVLITVDGECFFTQSTGILESVRWIATVFKERIHRGVKVRVQTMPTNSGNELKQLVILGLAS